MWQFKQTNFWSNEDETGSIAIKEFVWLKRKMYSVLVSDNSQHKKAQNVWVKMLKE